MRKTEIMVTEKNKEQFEEWYSNKILFSDIDNGIFPSHIELFYGFPFEMQTGVYLAYYDDKGYSVDVQYDDYFYMYFIIDKSINKTLHDDHAVKTRNEAYQEAFKQANEIVNKK